MHDKHFSPKESKGCAADRRNNKESATWFRKTIKDVLHVLDNLLKCTHSFYNSSLAPQNKSTTATKLEIKCILAYGTGITMYQH